MHQRQRHGGALSAYELGGLPSAALAEVTGLLEDLFKRSHLAGFFQEYAGGFDQILSRFFFGTSARGEVEFGSVGDVLGTLLENVGCELDVHK